MGTDRTDRDIADAFERGTPIDEALDEAVRQAVRLHKRMGQPMAAWRDGKTVWLSAEEVEAENASEQQPPEQPAKLAGGMHGRVERQAGRPHYRGGTQARRVHHGAKAGETPTPQ